MKYSDDLDRAPAAGLSRRQFLTAGGQRAARLAAGVILPREGTRLADTPVDPAARDGFKEEPDRRDGYA